MLAGLQFSGRSRAIAALSLVAMCAAATGACNRVETSPKGLLEAIRQHRPGEVARVLAAGVDANHRFRVDTTSIWRTLGNAIKLTRGRRHDTWPALVVAVGEGDPRAVSALLKAGAKPDARTGAGATALHHAARRGRAALVRLLLGARAPLEAKNGAGETPLVIAVKHGKLAATRMLIRAGAKLDARAHLGGTPLMMAVRGGHARLVTLLLAAQSPPRLSKADATELLTSAAAGNTKTLQKLLSSDKRREVFDKNVRGVALFRAAERGKTRNVAVLMVAGADVGVRGNFRYTPLHVAVANGHLGVVRVLLRQPGIDIEARDGWKNTPLKVAKANRRAAIARLLTQALAKRGKSADKQTKTTDAKGAKSAPATKKKASPKKRRASAKKKAAK